LAAAGATWPRSNSDIFLLEAGRGRRIGADAQPCGRDDKSNDQAAQKSRQDDCRPREQEQVTVFEEIIQREAKPDDAETERNGKEALLARALQRIDEIGPAQGAHLRQQGLRLPEDL
jgi:hypothetical protein